MKRAGVMTKRRLSYAKFRAGGLAPKDAYYSAGFSIATGCLAAQLKRIEKDPLVLEEMDRILANDKRTPEEKEADRIAKENKERAIEFRATMAEVEATAKTVLPKAREVFASRKIGKLSKDEIERRLIDLADKAEFVKDLGTARQCYEALGRNVGMFTPVQKIRIETVEDLSLDETESLIQKLMAAKRQENTPELEEDAGTAELLQ